MKCTCIGCGNEHEIDEQDFSGSDETQKEPSASEDATKNGQLDELEERARTETVCRGCNGEKGTGLIVCWPCFTYREDTVPFKDFDGTLSQWLQTV